MVLNVDCEGPFVFIVIIWVKKIKCLFLNQCEWPKEHQTLQAIDQLQTEALLQAVPLEASSLLQHSNIMEEQRYKA